MKTSYLILTFLILTASFFSCSKDDDDNIDYPLTVHLQDISYSNIRLFTNQGEIIDKNIINNFIKDGKSYFFLEQQDIQMIMSLKPSITFTSKDSITFLDANQYSVISDKKIILFYSDYYIPFDKYIPFNDQANHTFTIWDVVKYLAPKEPIPPLTGYTYKRKAVYTAQGNYNQFQLLGLNYRYVHHDENSPTFLASSIFNQFDESKVSILGIRDTLAIQEFKYYFRK